MNDQERRGFSDLFRIMIENFLFMFATASGVGFTLSAIGLLKPEYDIYMFTLAFSTTWGLVGASAAYARSREEVRTPELFSKILSAVGVSSSDQTKFESFHNVCRKRFLKNLFIPFVHTPDLR